MQQFILAVFRTVYENNDVHVNYADFLSCQLLGVVIMTPILH